MPLRAERNKASLDQLTGIPTTPIKFRGLRIWDQIICIYASNNHGLVKCV